MENAVVFNIMRYSIHDGPGIRTTVFFKGCPLSCKWCHNPEAVDKDPFPVFDEKKCIKCGRCDNCPTGARETIGYEINLSQLMEEIRKDLPFYEQSDGGVTFSGGEPFFQTEFLLQALEKCKEDYINTAIDTCGYCDSESILRAADKTSYILYDVKFIDSKKHEKYCGVPNKIILDNLLKLSAQKVKLLIRIPVIPTINDDLMEMTGIYEFIKDFKNIAAVHLLPYHNIHMDKYKRLGKVYELSEIPVEHNPEKSLSLEKIKVLFSGKFQTKIGG